MKLKSLLGKSGCLGEMITVPGSKNIFLLMVQVGLRLLYRTGPKEAVWSAMNLIIIYGWLEEIMVRVGQPT